MDIDLNKEECTEFLNFSIREYVAKIRKNEPKKCWPFGSLGDLDSNEVFTSYQSAESTSDLIEFLGPDNNMCKTVYDGSSEATSSIVNTTQCQYQKCIDEDARVGTSVTADNTEPEGKQMQKQPQKYRLLSDIYKDPASELRVRRHITNPEIVNSKFIAETEDENDDITLQEIIRKQKDVEITLSSKKRRKMIQDVKSIVDPDKKSKFGSKDSNGHDPVIGLRYYSRKETRIDDIDTQILAKRIKLRSSSPIDLSEKKGGPSSLDCKENAKQKECRLPCHQKMNKHTEFSNAKAIQKTSEDSEMEVVMLLACHFNKEDPKTNGQTEMVCACVQKKIGAFSTPFTYKSVDTKTPSKTAVAYADMCNKFIKEKKEKAICSSQVDGHSKMALKIMTARMFQAKLENCVLKAARNVENCSTLVCSLNRNPADFCKPNDHSKFMRGG